MGETLAGVRCELAGDGLDFADVAERGCRLKGFPASEIARWKDFAVADEGGILQGVFDRLVVLRDGSQIIGADVLDYKTDDVGAGPRAIDARVDAGTFARDGFLAVVVRGSGSGSRGSIAMSAELERTEV